MSAPNYINTGNVTPDTAKAAFDLVNSWIGFLSGSVPGYFDNTIMFVHTGTAAFSGKAPFSPIDGVFHSNDSTGRKQAIFSLRTGSIVSVRGFFIGSGSSNTITASVMRATLSGGNSMTGAAVGINVVIPESPTNTPTWYESTSPVYNIVDHELLYLEVNAQAFSTFSPCVILITHRVPTT